VPSPGEGFSATSASLPADAEYYSHVGLYGSRASFNVTWSPCPHQVVGSLEQLRVLWHSHKIPVGITDQYPGLSIDTEEELAQLATLLQN